MIPITLFIVIGAVFMANSPIGRAFAKRLGGEAGTDAAELRGEVAELHAEVEEMRTRMRQVDELQERVDFAERMLAQVRDKGALPGGR